MELTHRFQVPASIDETWKLLNDLHEVGECFPGAAVESVDGDDFSGTVKVKLGPISMQYKGTGTFTERDEQQYRAVIDAKGKDKRGNGTASANVSAQLTPDGDGTAIEVHTDLSVTGKPAQFGRGVIQDVSDKLLDQFVGCLSDKLSPAPEPAEEYVATGPAADGARAPEREAPSSAGSSPIGSSPVGSSPIGTSTVGSSAASSGSAGAELDLGSTVIPVLLRRYAAQIAGAVAAMLAVAWWRRRRKKRKA